PVSDDVERPRALGLLSPTGRVPVDEIGEPAAIGRAEGKLAVLRGDEDPRLVGSVLARVEGETNEGATVPDTSDAMRERGERVHRALVGSVVPGHADVHGWPIVTRGDGLPGDCRTKCAPLAAPPLGERLDLAALRIVRRHVNGRRRALRMLRARL